jgi:hypothetical protein
VDTCMWSDRGEEESSPTAAPAETKARNGGDGEGDDGGGVRATSAAKRSSLAERAMTTAERSSLGASSFNLGGGGLPREEAGLYSGYL